MLTLNLETNPGTYLTYEVCGVYEAEGKLYAILMESSPVIRQGNGKVHVKEVVISNETNMWYVSEKEDSIAESIKTKFKSNWTRFYFFRTRITEIPRPNDHEKIKMSLKYRDDLIHVNDDQNTEVYGRTLAPVTFKKTKNNVPSPLGSGYILSWDLVEWFYTLVGEPEERISEIEAQLNDGGQVRLETLEKLTEYTKDSPLPIYYDSSEETDSVINNLIKVFNRAISDCSDNTNRTKYLEIVKKIVDTVLSIDFIAEGDTDLGYHNKRAAILLTVLCPIIYRSLEELSMIEKFVDNPSWANFAKIQNEKIKKLKFLCCIALLDFEGEEAVLRKIWDNDKIDHDHIFNVVMLDWMQDKKFKNKVASKALSPEALATDSTGLKILAAKNKYMPLVEPSDARSPKSLTLARRRYHLPRNHF